MPSVIFHVTGKTFQPEAELAKTSFKPYRVFHVGEVKKWIRGDIVLKDSGFSVDIGPKSNDDLAAQIKVAARFVKKHFAEIKRLKNADEMRFDFGYGLRFDKDGEPFWVQCNRLPLDFLKMCSDLKIGIELSFYCGFTVQKLISNYEQFSKFMRPKQKRAAKK